MAVVLVVLMSVSAHPVLKLDLSLRQEEKLIPGPQNITQKTAVVVFLIWMWVSIVVLLYVLRLKVKELDRLERLGFFKDPDE